MNKPSLGAAIFVISTSSAFASDVHHISTTMLSGTAQDPAASFVNATHPTLHIDVKTWYVDTASGYSSNKTSPALQLARTSNWVFDFTNPAAVSFTGSLEMGDYRAQTTINGQVRADGRQTATGVVHTFSGIGTYDETSNTFSYNYLNGSANGGGASAYSAIAPTLCSNGQTSSGGSVCLELSFVSPAWEGLALSFVFAEDRNSFTGSLQGTNVSGSGLSNWSSQFNWYAPEVPIPASAWLLGSGLVGLVGARRSRERGE